MAQDSLSTLLGLQSTSNQTPGSRFAPVMSPNPRRNNAKVALLRRYLGLGGDDGGISETDLESAFGDVVALQADQTQREAEAKVLPERVRGEYSLEGERTKGRYALEAARMGREAAGTERQTAREFTAGQNQLNREAIAGRQTAAQAATTSRAQSREQAIAQRQKSSQAEGRIRAMEQGKAEPEYPETNGLLDTLKYYLGLGPYDRSTAVRTQADRLRQEAAQGPAGNDELSGIAQQYLQRYSDLSDDDLINMVIETQPDASPEELNALFDAINAQRR